jgi:hypothetical protein
MVRDDPKQQPSVSVDNHHRCFHLHNLQILEHKAPAKFFSTWYSPCQLYYDYLHASNGAYCKQPDFSFLIGVRILSFENVLIKQSLVVSGVTTKKWGNAAFLAVSVAVGLVPEMLPAIVNANLARGAFALSKNGAIIKLLDSVQVLGAMSVLCSDKASSFHLAL